MDVASRVTTVTPSGCFVAPDLGVGVAHRLYDFRSFALTRGNLGTLTSCSILLESSTFHYLEYGLLNHGLLAIFWPAVWLKVEGLISLVLPNLESLPFKLLLNRYVYLI